MRRSIPYISILTVLVCLCLAACGGNKDSAKSDDKLKLTNESDEPAGAFAPCQLLTSEQVATVLDDSDDGFVARDGGSLIDGVDTYQCSYSNEAGDLFTVVVHIAVDKERFDKVKPSASTIRMVNKDVKDVDAGDGGWLYGEPDDMKLKVVKGFSLIEFELMTGNAGTKGDALVSLVQVIAGRI